MKNLKALSAMLDESEPDQRILKAEIARELGEFDECLRLLSYQFDEGYEYAVGFIKKLAEEKVRAVKPFEPENEASIAQTPVKQMTGRPIVQIGRWGGLGDEKS